MNDTQNLDLATLATRTGEAVARLAQDDTLFRAAVDAFRAGDGDSFTRLLTRAKSLAYCEEICRWFASKHCVLDCLELCGPPQADVPVNQVAEATAAIARITQDEELVETLADVVARRDAAGFKAFINQQKLGAYCRFICSLVCTIRYSLICEVVCTPEEIPQVELADRLTMEGKALAQLAANRDQLQQIIDAAIALNCEFLQGVVGGFNDCYVICRWICSWRSILYCTPVCRAIEIPKDYIDEMRGFAQLSGRLADTQNAYHQFIAAIYSRDQQAFAGLV